MRWSPFMVLLVVLPTTVAVAEDESEGARVYSVPCVGVATYWPGPPAPEGSRRGPGLAVADTEIRPKRTRLFLDGRFIGQARSFDGGPDYLYLRPGRYRLEGRLGGYQTAVFEIDASESCRFNIRHRMVRDLTVAKERGLHAAVRPPAAQQRIFTPSTRPEAVPKRSGERPPGKQGPDVTLRPDLELSRRSSPGEEESRAPGEGAMVHLDVSPPTASVYLDGAFLASAEELVSMEEALAVAAGHHVVEVLAPGYVPAKVKLELTEGEVRDVEIQLEARLE